jgi:uncharacterized FlaG/YvyC family protein
MASQGIINNNKDRNKYFLCEEIDNNLICSICSGVLINPVQFKCCKKTVCKDCVLPSTSKETPDHNKCPICSCESLEFEQTFALNGVVQNMKICCMNNIDPRHPRQENLTEYDDRNLESIGNYSSMCYCSWTGNLSEWCDHDKNSCQLCEVSCSVGGCDFTGRRKDMEMHNSSSIVDHMQHLFGQRMLSVENNLLQIRSDREKGKKKTENDIKSLKAQFKNFQTKVHKEIKDLKKTIENTREEHDTTINGFTIRLQKGLDKKMDSNIVSIKEKKTEKVLEQITRKLFVELKSELELATEFIIDAKSEDLKIDIEETAKTIKEKLEGDFNDRFVNIASSIYSDIQRDLEHDLYRITDEKTKILVEEKIKSKFLNKMKSIKHIEAKIDADRFKKKAEMINVKKDLEEKLIQRIGMLFSLQQEEEGEKRILDKRRMSRLEGNQEKNSRRIKRNEHMVRLNGNHQSKCSHSGDEPNQKKRKRKPLQIETRIETWNSARIVTRIILVSPYGINSGSTVLYRHS